MVIKSRISAPVPQVSIPTYVFGSPTAELPDKRIFISASNPDKHYLTLHGYRQYAKRIASGLRHLGLQPGEPVMLFSASTLFYPTLFMGVIMAEGIFTGANPTYMARELAYQLKDSGARYLICGEDSLDTGLAAAKEVGLSAEQVFILDDGAATLEGRKVEKSTELGHIRHWTELLDTPEKGDAYEWPELRTPEELNRVVALNYSSGTTGVAKGVMITHTNHIANTVQLMTNLEARDNYQELVKRKVYLGFLPMYHALAQATFCMGAVKERVPVYIMPKFDFLQFLQYVQKYRVTDLTLVPPIVVTMAKQPATKQVDLSSVERASCGAAPLGKEIIEEFERLWPNRKVGLTNGWGMTELTCIGTLHRPGVEYRPSSVGELSANVEAKIVLDDEGKVEAPRGERGEIWIRGPNVMKGYWNKPGPTAETLTKDGWLKTGDIAYVDENNHFYIVDRRKELIKVKGLQVAPAELEALLLDHPDIQDAAVIGVAVDGTELPRAYVVLQPSAKPTPETAAKIKAWLAERVSKYKRLEGGVHFLDAIPKNPSGKILRRELRELAARENAKAKL